MKAFRAVVYLALGLSLAQAAQAEQLTVFNEAHQPVAGAEVLVGNAPGVPFEGNVLTTDANGVVQVPTLWKTILPVTIKANGYISSTFLALAPLNQALQMHRLESRTPIEMKGETKNFGTLKRDGLVDFGLVFPGLTAQQMNRFDIEAMISSEVDKIKVITEELSLPSNLTLPEQKESYILPITLNKPLYRMAFKQTGQYRMMALHGQFPLKKVVDEIRGDKTIYDVVNQFSFLRAGQRDVTLNGPIAGQDIPVDQLSLTKKIAATAPAFPADLLMFSFAMIEQGPLSFPTDLKRLMPNETLQLGVPATADKTALVSMLATRESFNFGQDPSFKTRFNNPEDISPAAALPYFFKTLGQFLSYGTDGVLGQAGGVSLARHAPGEATPNFLDLVPRPILAAGKLTVTPPRPVAGLEPVATYAILAESDATPAGGYSVTRRYRMWQIAQPGWVNELVLPQAATNLPPGKKYRWEVLFMARRSGHNGQSDYFLDNVTHVSRNALDF